MLLENYTKSTLPEKKLNLKFHINNEKTNKRAISLKGRTSLFDTKNLSKIFRSSTLRRGTVNSGYITLI